MLASHWLSWFTERAAPANQVKKEKRSMKWYTCWLRCGRKERSIGFPLSWCGWYSRYRVGTQLQGKSWSIAGTWESSAQFDERCKFEACTYAHAAWDSSPWNRGRHLIGTSLRPLLLNDARAYHNIAQRKTWPTAWSGAHHWGSGLDIVVRGVNDLLANIFSPLRISPKLRVRGPTVLSWTAVNVDFVRIFHLLFS